MKSILKKLEMVSGELGQKIQLRTDYVDGHSEAWQDSEKCEEFEDRTSDFDEKKQDLDSLIEEMKELL